MKELLMKGYKVSKIQGSNLAEMSKTLGIKLQTVEGYEDK